MLRPLSVVLALGLLGCPEPAADVDPEVVDTDGVDTDGVDTDGVDTDADDGDPDPAEPEPSAANGWGLAHLDIQGAHDHFATGRAAGDSGDAFGWAVTGLMLMPDWAEIDAILTDCNEANGLVDEVYGIGGVAMDYTRGLTGAASLTVQLDEGSGPAAAGQFADPEQVFTSLEDDGDELTISVIDADVGELWISVPTLALSAGVVIDVEDLTEEVGSVRFYPDCDVAGSGCRGWGGGGPATGTLTFTAWGSTPGSAVVVDVDVQVPASCGDSGLTGCDAIHTVVGTITDDLTDIDLEWIPFYEETAPCGDTIACGDFAFIGYAAEFCDVDDVATIHGWVGDIGDHLEGIAEAFEEAGADPAMSFTFPEDGVWVFAQDARFNQADSLALAASMRASAMVIETALAYTWLDMDAAPEDLVDVYDEPGIDWDLWDGEGEPVCGTEETLGMPATQAQSHLDEHFFRAQAGATLAVAGASLEAAFDDLIAAAAADPSAPGVVDFSATRRMADGRWRDAMAGDLVAARDAVDAGTYAALPSATDWGLDGAAFAGLAPDASTVMADKGIGRIVRRETGECGSEWVAFHSKFGTWLTEGAGLATVPVREDDYGIPSFADEDLFDPALTDDGVPYFLDMDEISAVLGLE